MWTAPAAALTSGAFLGLTQLAELPRALPFLGLWLAAPWIAWWISQPIEAPGPALTSEQVLFLRRIARKTWHFFETFVTAQENWLPPDNFQEEPFTGIAARTSPTNIGLALLANLAARDFGYLSVGRLIQRTEGTLATMGRLERHRGHFYNWYDTRTLTPLLPLYVSSVDSGNLAGHLLTLGAGLRELANAKIFDPEIFAGLHDTVKIMQSLGGEKAALARLEAALTPTPSTARAACEVLQQTLQQAAQFSSALAKGADDLRAWAQILHRSCEEHLQELLFLAPWLARADLKALRAPEDLVEKFAGLEADLSLREISTLDQNIGPQLAGRAGLAPWEECLREASSRASQRMLALENLARQSAELAEMDFSFLFDPARELFSIGFNVTERRPDASFYDLLASEARLCSYVVIAQGQVPQDHWFALGPTARRAARRCRSWLRGAGQCSSI